jgi:hypothetical protein
MGLKNLTSNGTSAPASAPRGKEEEPKKRLVTPDFWKRFNLSDFVDGPLALYEPGRPEHELIKSPRS